MHYTIATSGPAAAPSFQIQAQDRSGVHTIAKGPADGESYAQSLDYAARLCAYANVALAQAEAVRRVEEIDNSPNLAAVIAEAGR